MLINTKPRQAATLASFVRYQCSLLHHFLAIMLGVILHVESRGTAVVQGAAAGMQLNSKTGSTK